jgi:hypothetical protein
MNWLQRLARLENKRRKATIKRTVRAYRKRQEQAGMRRVDIALTAEQFALLQTFMLPTESFSKALGRLLESGK